MSPKEKAEELFDKMSSQTYWYQPYAGALYSVEEIGWEAGKKCALIAVEEIQDFITKYNNPFEDFKYLDEVKNEIEKL
jgi:hypothetical protein